MASVRRLWVCKNSDCKNEKGKHRGYKKVDLGEKEAICKWCKLPMVKGGYRSRINKNGIERTKTTRVKADAEAHQAACVTARAKGDLLPGEETLISWQKGKETFERWIQVSGISGELSKETAKYYTAGLKMLESYRGAGDERFADYALQEIEKPMVKRFKNKRKAEVKASTVNCALATLKRMFTIVCDELPARRFPRLHDAKTDLFKVSLMTLDNRRDNILETQEEIDILLEECRVKSHLYRPVFIALNTGLREDGCLSLRRSEINFDTNLIRKVVKGKKEVFIPLTDELRKELQSWLSEQKVTSITGLIIPSPKNPNKAMKSDSDYGFDSAKRRAAKRLRDAGKEEAAARMEELHFHDLRHTFATHYLYKTSKVYGSTVAVQNLSQILGHSTTYITERYAHVLQAINQEAMQAYGAQMFAAKFTDNGFR